jgi:hypothetical protein
MATVAHPFRLPNADCRCKLLLVDSETLDPMNLRPGIIRVNITTQGLNVDGSTPGEQVAHGLCTVTGKRSVHSLRSTEKGEAGPAPRMVRLNALFCAGRRTARNRRRHQTRGGGRMILHFP